MEHVITKSSISHLSQSLDLRKYKHGVSWTGTSIWDQLTQRSKGANQPSTCKLVTPDNPLHHSVNTSTLPEVPSGLERSWNFRATRCSKSFVSDKYAVTFRAPIEDHLRIIVTFLRLEKSSHLSLKWFLALCFHVEMIFFFFFPFSVQYSLKKAQMDTLDALLREGRYCVKVLHYTMVFIALLNELLYWQNSVSTCTLWCSWLWSLSLSLSERPC